MKVQKKHLNKWNRKNKRGDMNKIHLMSIDDNNKVSRMALTRAMKLGVASENTISVINKYFDNKVA